MRVRSVVAMLAFAPIAFAPVAYPSCASASRSSADDPTETPLRVVLARTGGTALVLWNATPFVSSFVAKRVDDRTANDILERGALRAAALELPSLSRAKTIDVRVLYDKTGEVSPVYGDATFAGVERYALLELDGARARADADRWRELRPRDPLPAWISYRVLGSLPPRS